MPLNERIQFLLGARDDVWGCFLFSTFFICLSPSSEGRRRSWKVFGFRGSLWRRDQGCQSCPSWGLVNQSVGIFLRTRRSRFWRSLFNWLQGTKGTRDALLWDIRSFRFLCFIFLKNFKTIFVFWPWSICKRRMILRRNLVLRHLRLLSPGRMASINNRLELYIFGSWEICWFLWFCKLGETFGEVAVYMIEVSFERDLLVI